MRASTLLILVLAAEAAGSCSRGGGASGNWISHVPVPVVSLATNTDKIDAVEGSSETVVVTSSVTNPTDPPPSITIGFSGLPAGVTASQVTFTAGSSGAVVIHVLSDAPQRDWKSVDIVGSVDETRISGRQSVVVPMQLRVRGSPGTADTTNGPGGLAQYSVQTALSAGYEPDGTLIYAGVLPCANGVRCMGALVNRPLPITATFVPVEGYETEGVQVLVAPDGSFFLNGVTLSPANILILAHWAANGTLVGSFGAGGAVETALPQNVTPVGLAFDRAGLLQLAATSATNVLLHFTPTGQPDSYGSSGQFAFNWEGGTGGGARALAVDSAGRAVVAGNRVGGGFAIARVTTSGQLDASFASSGIYLSASGSASGVTVLPDGRIVVCDSVVVLGRSRIQMEAFTPAGVPATSFGNGGVVTISHVGEDFSCTGLGVDSKGRLIVLGVVSPEEATGRVVVARYFSNGSFDPTFDAAAGYRAFFPSVSPVSLGFDSEQRISVVGQLGPTSPLGRIWP